MRSTFGNAAHGKENLAPMFRVGEQSNQEGDGFNNETIFDSKKEKKSKRIPEKKNTKVSKTTRSQTDTGE